MGYLMYFVVGRHTVLKTSWTINNIVYGINILKKQNILKYKSPYKKCLNDVLFKEVWNWFLKMFISYLSK